MPVKRRLHKGRAHRITDDAVEAWRVGDFHALNRALGIQPHEASPFDVDQRTPEENAAMEYAYQIWNDSWPLAQELQRELLKHGQPGRVGRHGEPWSAEDDAMVASGEWSGR